jgi:release factor glutamine methyltransferase
VTTLLEAGFCASMPREAARRTLVRAFTAANIESAELDARVLLCAALEIDHAGLIRDSDAPLGRAAAILSLFALRRLRREPVSRIIGYKEFWGERFTLSSAVLDPRPDTETLIEGVLAYLGGDSKRRMRILDLGVGSGAILGALLRCLPLAFGVGVDLSPAACAIAQTNLRAQGLGVRGKVICSDWTSALQGGFDLIVSNPPYIPAEEISGLEPEVRDYDPRLALDGGEEGLSTYRAIIPPAASLLAPSGVIALEFGPGQREPVETLLRSAALEIVNLGLDLNGCERIILAKSA